jgi:hypothetical protein
MDFDDLNSSTLIFCLLRGLKLFWDEFLGFYKKGPKPGGFGDFLGGWTHSLFLGPFPYPPKHV